MIGRLQGILVSKKAPAILVDVNGVGYELEAPMSTFYDLPEVGAKVSLHTHLVVREDAHLLYGFLHDSDRQLFRTLIRVSGVGAKLALTLLSGMSRQEFINCIQESDITSLTRLPGVGRKTAERLVVELRDRLKDISGGGGGGGSEVPVSTGRVEPNSPVAEAVDALVALGYKPQEASRMVRLVPGEGLASEEIIRQALQGAVRQ